MGFNPRSPRGGATIKFVKSSIVLILFQSTLPTRGSDFNFRSFFKPDYGFNPRSPRGGATRNWAAMWAAALGFNPRSPRGGATYLGGNVNVDYKVSIHAPHEGERQVFATPQPYFIWFQSTLPTRGSDAVRARLMPRQFAVSIHAPHEGERRRKSAFVCSISANLLNIIHCGTVTRAVSRRRIALFRLFSVRRSGVFMYAYASH